eukprot:879839_1
MALLAHSIYLFVMWWVTSIIEWAYHRWGMHGQQSKIPTKAFREVCARHLIHHQLTFDDMSLNTNKNKSMYEKYKIDMKLAEYEGIYFLWPVTTFTYIPFFVEAVIANFLLSVILSPFMIWNVSYLNAIFYNTLCCTYMNAVWNYYIQHSILLDL